MKFLVVLGGFSLLAAAIPAPLPSEVDLRTVGAASDMVDMKDMGDLGEMLDVGDLADVAELEAIEAELDDPDGKGKGKGKDAPAPKSKGDAPAPKSKGDAPKSKGDAPKPSGGTGKIKCAQVAVLFSRGTFEVGSQGLTVGSPFTTALQAVLPSGTIFWGNEYNNDVIGYLTGGSVQGSSQMKNKAQSFVDNCPSIKLVMGGYSQGAQVTHHALESANAKTKAAVKAVVLFGDPLSGRPIPGIPNDRIKTICASGDTICWGLPVVTIAHMAYGATDSVSAAAWVRTKVNA